MLFEPDRGKERRGWEMLRKNQILNLYFQTDVILAMKYNATGRGTENIGRTRKTEIVLFGNLEGRKPRGIHVSGLEYNIKVALKGARGE